MGLQFIDNVKGNDRGFIQEFIEKEVDRDTDLYTATVSKDPGNYAYVRRGWHKTDEDPEDHITADVYLVRSAHLRGHHWEAYSTFI
jgi:hypothetical protein